MIMIGTTAAANMAARPAIEYQAAMTDRLSATANVIKLRNIV
jgi:hypothetical protein